MRLKQGILILLLAGLTLFTACQKEYGTEKGNGTIEGTLYIVNHPDDNYLFQCDTMIAADENVYISSKDEEFYGDKSRTNINGKFKFYELKAGEYTIYAYSETANGEKIIEQKIVNLKMGDNQNVGDLYIHTGKTYQTSMIHGKVKAQYFDKDGYTVKYDWAYGTRVYIQHLNDKYYFNDTRVGADGSYYFQKLQPGTYVVYAYSEDVDTQVPTPVYDTITITEPNTDIDGGEINISLKA